MLATKRKHTLSKIVLGLDAKAKALSDAGFAVVNWEPEHLDILQKYGLKAMVHDPTPEIASRLADHPAVWGYNCGDEPYPEEEFPGIAVRFEALKKADPNHAAFVNMLSTTGEFLAIVTHPRIYTPPTPLEKAIDQEEGERSSKPCSSK